MSDQPTPPVDELATLPPPPADTSQGQDQPPAPSPQNPVQDTAPGAGTGATPTPPADGGPATAAPVDPTPAPEPSSNWSLSATGFYAGSTADVANAAREALAGFGVISATVWHGDGTSEDISLAPGRG